MRYPSVVDDDKSVLLGLHGPIAVPSTVFVRADGTVAHIHPGEYDSATELRADIDHYLGVSA
jgi:flagellar basal body rod protein FlgF